MPPPAPPPSKPPPLLTVAEVARIARVSKMSIYRRIHEGELPALRFGRQFRIRDIEFRAWLSRAATWDDE